jgi:Rod binding domain-containing protein
MSIGPVGGATTALAAPPKNEKLDKATKDFEGVWLAQILREARPKGGMFSSSFAAETFQDMMSQTLGQSMAESGKLGFAKKLYDHLNKTAQTQAAPGVAAGEQAQSSAQAPAAGAATPVANAAVQPLAPAVYPSLYDLALPAPGSLGKD